MINKMAISDWRSMRFNRQVVEFSYKGIPMVGNTGNGYVIGLTQDGLGICHKMFDSDMAEDDIRAVDENLLIHLEKGGFFTEKPSRQPITTAYLHVTQNCNLSCIGCYSYDSRRNDSEDPSFEKITQAISQLSAHGIKRLVISGGEPFLREDLPAIVKYAKETCEIGCVDVITNGTVVDSEQLKLIAPFISRICVSFDGYSENSAAYIRKEQRFSQLVETVKNIQRAGIHAHLTPTIHAKNYKDIKEYFELSKQLNTTITFSLFSAPYDQEATYCLIPSVQDLENIAGIIAYTSDELASLFQDMPTSKNLTVKTSCGAAQGIISISYDGKVYPCHMLHDDRFLMGSIFDDCLDKTLDGDVCREMADINIESIAACSNCEVRFFCGGGCRARSFYLNGGVYGRDPYCNLMKTFYDLSFRKMLATN